MSALKLLNDGLLTDLEAQWRRQRAPLTADLQPGVSADDLEIVHSRLDLCLPDEARLWWRWRNGVALRDERPDLGAILGSLWFLSLHNAADEYLFQREIAEHVAGGQEDTSAEDLWPVWLFPLTFGRGASLAFDVSAPRREVAEVYSVPTHDARDFDVPAARSLGEVVGVWVEALASDSCRWNPETQFWDIEEGFSPLIF